MTLSQLLSELAVRGVRLEGKGNQLRYFPRSAVTPEMEYGLRQHKGVLLKILASNGNQVPPDLSEPQDLWNAILLRLEPEMPQDVLEGLRHAEARWSVDDSQGAADDCDSPDEPF